MKRIAGRLVCLATVAAALPGLCMADDGDPAGLWKSIDDQSGKPKALIRITESSGEYRGRIEKLFPADGVEPQALCAKCEGALKDQPIVGMTIITGMKRDGSDAGLYGSGQILDPANGKTYRSRMTLADGGKKLQVRGYIGTPLLGRTQVWLREP